jgi:hypothetical protein
VAAKENIERERAEADSAVLVATDDGADRGEDEAA